MSPIPARAVVITGASTGIGEACAILLDRLGYRVFAGVRREEDSASLRRNASGRLTPIRLDVTDAGSIAAAAAIVTDALGDAGLAGLVNNAGIAVAAPLEFVPIDRLRAQLEVNVIGQIAVTQAFLPLIRRERGRVVNMSSVSGRIASPLVGPYTASKFALEALTDSLRVELRPWGIHVIAIEPGTIATPIWAKSAAAAEAMLATLPERAQALYGSVIAGMRRRAERATERGIPPEAVADVVADALAAPRPQTRYIVGSDARIGVLLAHLPDRARDWVIARRLRVREPVVSAPAAPREPAAN